MKHERKLGNMRLFVNQILINVSLDSKEFLRMQDSVKNLKATVVKIRKNVNHPPVKFPVEKTEEIVMDLIRPQNVPDMVVPGLAVVVSAPA